MQNLQPLGIDMKLRLFSDLHIECHRGEMDVWQPCELPDDKETVLILAGDIDTGMHAIDYCNNLRPRFKAVIYVGGNHDLWKQILDTFYDKAREAAVEGVYVLQNDAVTIDDVEFLGTTLWTDMNRRDPFDTWNAPNVMRPDFKKIRDGGGDKRFLPMTWLAENFTAREFLKKNLTSEKQQVVVTHHAPDFQCAEGNECAGNGGDVYYYNRDMEECIEIADLWLFGHTHHAFDKEVCGTRIISNARGYQSIWSEQLVDEFNETGLIEI
jgi:predicted phosphohydrolase